MRADKILMLGVGALGAYAVYRLVTAPGGPSPTFDQRAPLPPAVPGQLDPATDAALPNAPGAPGPVPAGFPIVDGASPRIMHMVNSRAYRGRLELLPGTPDESARSFVAMQGFEPDSVQIFKPGDPRTGGAIPEFARLNPGRGTRWFAARWTSPTADVRRDDSIVLLWTTAAAPPRV